MKKILSIFVCIMLLFTLFSSTVFAADTCTFSIVVEPAEGGWVSDNSGSVSGAKEYPKDSLVNFNAAPKNGYHFSEWKKDGSSLGNAASYAFVTDGNHTITAVFEKHSYNYKSDANGHWYECSCGNKQGSSEAHSPKKVNEKAATETKAGYTGDTVCSVCGFTIESGKEIPATGSTASKNSGAASSAYTGTTSSKESTSSAEATSSKAKPTTSSVVTQTNSVPTNTNTNEESSSTVVVGTNSSETIGSVTTEKNDNKNNNNNTILFVVIGVAAVIILAAGIAAILVFTKKEPTEEAAQETETEASEETKE